MQPKLPQLPHSWKLVKHRTKTRVGFLQDVKSPLFCFFEVLTVGGVVAQEETSNRQQCQPD